MLYCILDIDGSIADISHREYLIEGPEKDWDEFFNPKLVAKDKPISTAQEFAKKVDLDDLNIILLTGRPERLRDVTIDWLKKYYPKFSKARLLMRADTDFSLSSKYKTNTFINEILKTPEITDEDSFIFIDDEDPILYVFSNYGLALKAPECWPLLVHPKPLKKEQTLK